MRTELHTLKWAELWPPVPNLVSSYLDKVLLIIYFIASTICSHPNSHVIMMLLNYNGVYRVKKVLFFFNL